MKKQKKSSIPLYLTSIRLLLSPLFVIFYLYYDKMGISFFALSYYLIGIVVLSEVSDLLDGFFARRYNQVTELGKLFDPMADTLFRLSVLFAFTKGVVQLPVLLILFILYREIIISTLRTVCALRGVALAARMSGKMKAVLLGVISLLILCLMIPYSMGDLTLKQLRLYSFYSVLIGTLYTLYTGVEYIWVNRSYIRKAISS